MTRPLVQQLQLQPHPEGGAFREVWRSPQTLTHPATGAPRSASTAIYFHLADDEFSALHEVSSDEIWILLDGGPLELHRITPDGAHVGVLLRRGDPDEAPNLMHVVPAGDLQAARPARGATHVLCACIVAPGFDFQDFRMPPRTELLDRFPALAGLVLSLTREAIPHP